MEHITFQGGMGTTRLGTFTTKTSGVGDTQLSGLFRLHDDGRNHVHPSCVASPGHVLPDRFIGVG
jgi:hypothetical protein